MNEDPDENLYIDREENGCRFFDDCAVNECPLNLATKKYYRKAADGDFQSRCHLPIPEREPILNSMTAEHRALLLHDGLQRYEYDLKTKGLLAAYIKRRQEGKLHKAQAWAKVLEAKKSKGIADIQNK